MSDQRADQFQARITWCATQPMLAGRKYLLAHQDAYVSFVVTAIKYREGKQPSEHLSAKIILSGETAIVNLSVSSPLELEAVAPFMKANTEILIADANTFSKLGACVIEFALHRATNIRWQNLTINKAVRASLNQQIPRCIWFTGLSGSGKSTIANVLEKQLFEQGLHTYLLDGDNLRHGLNRDLGFTEADRVENIRRVAEVAHLMVDAGLIVIASFISPYRSERLMARNLFEPNEFLEVFVDTPLSECEKRDVKGLYAKARRGELKNFTGIDSAYEVPERPEVHLDTKSLSVNECADTILLHLAKK